MCGVPFTRTGAALSSHFYRTAEENDTCIVCREGLDPVTLEPLPPAPGEPMKKPERMSDGEIVEAILIVSARARMADAGDVRKSADVLADLAIEAGARIANRGRDVLRDRASRLEDAAFHFQTCSVCKRQGEDFCSSGQRFAAYLRGEENALDQFADERPGPLVGRARNVVIHGDGRLTCELEIADGAAGARFLEQIGGRS